MSKLLVLLSGYPCPDLHGVGLKILESLMEMISRSLQNSSISEKSTKYYDVDFFVQPGMTRVKTKF